MAEKTGSGSLLKDGIFYTGDKGPKFGVRYFQIILMSLAYSQSFATKASFSVALVAMTDNTSSPNPNVPTYQWDNINIIISAILWSGIPFTLIAGYMGKQCGPKWILVICVTANSLAFILIPAAARLFGSTGVIICRVIQGIFVNSVYGQSSVVMGRWAPPEERSRMGYILSALITMFAMTASFANGHIAQTELGWPWIFYIFGSVGFLIATLVALFAFQSAENHPRITPEELKYLETSLFKVNIKYRTPWMKILKSVHCWAIIMGITGYNWFLILLITEFSVFLAKVFKFDLADNGTISALPSLSGAITGIPLSYLSDFITNRGILSVVNSRRSFHLLGVIGISVSNLSLTYIPMEQRWWVLALICVSQTFIMMAGMGGASINILDLSPKYAGIIGGTALSFSNCLSIFAPLVVNWLCTGDMSDVSQWRTVYLISSAISIGTGVLFVVFATDQRQNWDDESEEEARAEIERRKSSRTSITKSIAI